MPDLTQIQWEYVVSYIHTNISPIGAIDHAQLLDVIKLLTGL